MNARATVVTMLATLVAACGGGGQGAQVATSTPSPRVAAASPTPAPVASSEPELSRIALPVPSGTTVEGLVDVGGHDIYARCSGQGEPTVVYFTGWAEDRNKHGVAIAQVIEYTLGPNIRVCSYERRNTGRSEAVEGTQEPEDVIADIDGFLDALGEKGPFVLLGASFGGQIAAVYAVAHPDRVVGVVNLDGSTGVEYEIDEQGGFLGACLEANRNADAWDSLEKLDNCSLAEYIHERRDQEPDVPLIYIAAKETWPDSSPALKLAREWVESWSPGKWQETTGPHWIDLDDPALVAAAVREVIDLAGTD